MVALAGVGVYDKESFRARWLSDMATLLRGVSADGLATMGEWVVEQHLWPARRQIALDLLADAVRDARTRHPETKALLATGAYQQVGDAFARRIGADGALGTPLELREGVATGKLAAPMQSGQQKAAAILARAAGGELLAAFGDAASDIPLLALATRAVAIAPDADLRRAAIARGWEIVDSP
jgi:phosphoserine phosphatase